MLRNYILAPDGEPIPCTSPLVWGRWMQTAERVVAYNVLPNGAAVSTVFLGIDHNFEDTGPPILWETMVFWPNGMDGDETQQRYRSRADALAGHEAAINAILGTDG